MRITRFEKFLINRGVLELFEKSYRSNSINGHTYENFINHFSSSDFVIRAAFTWSDTPEGYDFWRKLNVDWNESLEKNTL